MNAADVHTARRVVVLLVSEKEEKFIYLIN